MSHLRTIGPPLIALFIIGLSACNWTRECREGSGPVVTVEATTEPFEGIVVEGSLEVMLHFAEARSILVEGPSDLIDLVEVEMEDGIAHLRTTRCYRSEVPFMVHITHPSLKKVHLNGSGSIISEGIMEVGTFDVEVHGSGDISMEVEAARVEADVMGSGDIVLGGVCEDLRATVAGSGDVNTMNLQCTRADVVVTGSGDVRVNALKELNAAITGSGDIHYRGTPALQTQVTGSGKIHQE